jgi:hypothetical protein
MSPKYSAPLLGSCVSPSSAIVSTRLVPVCRQQAFPECPSFSRLNSRQSVAESVVRTPFMNWPLLISIRPSSLKSESRFRSITSLTPRRSMGMRSSSHGATWGTVLLSGCFSWLNAASLLSIKDILSIEESGQRWMIGVVGKPTRNMRHSIFHFALSRSLMCSNYELYTRGKSRQMKWKMSCPSSCTLHAAYSQILIWHQEFEYGRVANLFGSKLGQVRPPRWHPCI